MRKWILSFIFIATPCIAAEPPQISKKEQEAKFNQMFKAIDTNDDGKISREEVELKEPNIANNFEQMDTNHDGGLTKKEIKDTVAAVAKKRNEFYQSLQKADKNNDGKLSREEAKTVPHRTEKFDLAAHFDEIDSNHDGQLILKEIADYVRGMSAPQATQ